MLLLGGLLLPIAVSAETGSQVAIGGALRPTVSDVMPVTEDLPDEELIGARIGALIDFDIDHWIRRATLSGPLTYYSGDLADHRQVAKYLVQRQRLAVPDAPEVDYRAGGWKGDNTEGETFDEGGHGRAMLVIASMLKTYGNIWTFNHPSGGQRDMLMALESGVQCSLLNQFQAKHHDFPNNLGWYGIPGPWPQSQGWRTGEAKFPLIAGLRTYNDFATSDTLLGIVGARELLPEYAPLIDEAVELCATGTRIIQRRNHGGLPEQCDAWGVPVWGRGHEPPSISPRSTALALHIYMAAHAISGDAQWLGFTLETIDWLNQTNLGNDAWEMGLEANPGVPPSQWAPIWGDSKFNIVHDRDQAHLPATELGNGLTHSPFTAIGQALRYFEAIECTADLDGDGDIDVLDFAVLASQFGWEGGVGQRASDYDNDGDVDVLDFAVLVSEFGCVPSTEE